MGVCESKSPGFEPTDELLYSAAVSSEVGASMMELETVEGLELASSPKPPSARIAEQLQDADRPSSTKPENLLEEDPTLIQAAAKGDLELVRGFLMDTDISVDHIETQGRHKGKTALLAACEGGDAEVVSALLSARASLNTQSLPNYEGRCRIASTPCLQVCYQFIRRGLTGDTKVRRHVVALCG